jgi:tetratricopeptide (TPR) repeat protein
MAESWLDEESLAFYHSLAKRLCEGHLSPAEAAAESRRVHPSPAVVERLRAEAEQQIGHAPREGWALAHVACAVAQELGRDLLQAECALTLAKALNALGRFADAVPILNSVSEPLLAHDRPDLAGRCCSEIALSCTFLGQFEVARTVLARAQDILAGLDDPLAQAHCDRAEGLLHQEQNRYPEAVALLRQAGDAFAAAGCGSEAALTWCDLAYNLRYIDPQDALFWLDKARCVPMPGESPVHPARCDYILAVIYEGLNRYAESLILCRQARVALAEEGLDFLAAFCDLCQGIVHYHLNQYDAALQTLNRARTSYAARALSSHVAMCDLNIAVVFYATNRYAEALKLYDRVAEEALAEGRVLRAARCHTNMGLCYDRLGRYDQALALHDRARQAFLEAGSPVYAALCQENLAGTFRRLGRHQTALVHYQQVQEIFAREGMPVYGAYCDTQLADLYLALGQHGRALACLGQARMTCQQEGMVVYVAACDRERARVLLEMGQRDEAHALLAQAKAIFAAKGLLVDAVLCDLAAGEVHLEQGEVAEAARLFAETLTVLAPGFPDDAWRAWYGLGRCALVQGDRSRTLEHWLSAVELTSQIRAALPTERLSGGFFASRRRLYEETFVLALEEGAKEQALAVAEASKAQTFLTLRAEPFRHAQDKPFEGLHTECSRSAQDRPQGEAWTGHLGWHGVGRDDPYLAELLSQEERLRREMESLRRELRLLEADEARPILRSEGELHSDQPQALARLAELSQVYEEVVEKLRLAAPGWLEAHSPVPFLVEALRQVAAAHLPSRWACLNYYVLDDAVVTFYLDAQRLTVHRRPLNAYDSLALRQCTDPAGEFRELIYRGTIRGHRTPGDPGRTYLQHLYRLLIPPEVEDLGEDDLLFIAPHGFLHGLAFQALLAGEKPLVIRVPLTYIPSLGVLQLLRCPEPVEGLRDPARNDSIGRVLVCGLSDFGSRASPLPHAVDEVAALRQILGEQLDVLWGSEATRGALLRLNETGDLAGYDAIHFATHTVLDHLAPSQSRVLLADDSLALADVLNLRLMTRMVVLSGCEAAMGQRYPGDEVMGLARAFFLAGARTVVASLWPVEDACAGEFMGRLYSRLGAGEGVAQALRAVQVEMAGEGYAPYQWAPFIAIGLP